MIKSFLWLICVAVVVVEGHGEAPEREYDIEFGIEAGNVKLHLTPDENYRDKSVKLLFSYLLGSYDGDI